MALPHNISVRQNAVRTSWTSPNLLFFVEIMSDKVIFGLF